MNDTFVLAPLLVIFGYTAAVVAVTALQVANSSDGLVIDAAVKEKNDE